MSHSKEALLGPINKYYKRRYLSRDTLFNCSANARDYALAAWRRSPPSFLVLHSCGHFLHHTSDTSHSQNISKYRIPCLTSVDPELPCTASISMDFIMITPAIGQLTRRIDSGWPSTAEQSAAQPFVAATSQDGEAGGNFAKCAKCAHARKLTRSKFKRSEHHFSMSRHTLIQAKRPDSVITERSGCDHG
jgi:hypothetical protein